MATIRERIQAIRRIDGARNIVHACGLELKVRRERIRPRADGHVVVVITVVFRHREFVQTATGVVNSHAAQKLPDTAGREECQRRPTTPPGGAEDVVMRVGVNGVKRIVHWQAD